MSETLSLASIGPVSSPYRAGVSPIRTSQHWHRGGSPHENLRLGSVLGCLLAAFTLSAWSVIAAGAFFLSALLLTVRLHCEAAARYGRGAADGNRRR